MVVDPFVSYTFRFLHAGKRPERTVYVHVKDVLLFGGGIIPDQDVPELKRLGVRGIFGLLEQEDRKQGQQRPQPGPGHGEGEREARSSGQDPRQERLHGNEYRDQF